MQKFTNPLDNIRIASPCPADWNEMRGDERSRFCSQCRLSVYNLSDMTREEAERFLINAEGRVCIKYYRRRDGAVLTRDCPVGRAKLKKKVSRISTAVFTFVFSLFTGLFAFHQTETDPLDLRDQVTVETDDLIVEPKIPVMGQPKLIKPEAPEFIERKVMGELLIKNSPNDNKKSEKGERSEKVRRLEDEPVVVWIE